jgi:aldehyde dehydrogenase (NAD+)
VPVSLPAVDDNADELAELETRQNGKLLREMQGQMETRGEWHRYYAGPARR